MNLEDVRATTGASFLRSIQPSDAITICCKMKSILQVFTDIKAMGQVYIINTPKKISLRLCAARLGMLLLCRPLKSAGRSPPCTTIVRDVGDAVCTQRSGGQPEYEPIRAACNRLARLSTCTCLLQRRCESGARRGAQHLDIRCARHSTAYAYL